MHEAASRKDAISGLRCERNFIKRFLKFLIITLLSKLY